MAFGQGRKKYDGSMLDLILPEYEMASKIIYSMTEVLGWDDIRKNYPDRDAAAKQRDRFEDAWKAKEAAKLYKAIDDDTGFVYLIANPITWGLRGKIGEKCTLVKPVPRKVGHINDLLKSAAQTGAQVGAVDWGDI